MELRSVTYEERRAQFFKEKIETHEEIIEIIKASDITDAAKHDALSGEGEELQFYTDALNALNWIKIENDEEGKLVSFPSPGECALFCRKDGGIFIDEVCADDVEDGEWQVYLEGNRKQEELIENETTERNRRDSESAGCQDRVGRWNGICLSQRNQVKAGRRCLV